jgi:aspergillopepsin I
MRDTGSSLWYLPKPVADAYYAKISGAAFSQAQGGWTIPCATAMPDMSVFLGGKKVTVPGININVAPISAGKCMGGIQRGTGLGNIFGDVFFKGLFIIHEYPVNGKPRIGFATQAK